MVSSNTAIVIPCWNNKDIIGKAIRSLQKQSLPVDIIVVENGSVDGSLEYLKKEFPSIKLVINKKNLGFAGGVNSGIRYALQGNYQYIGLLNSDAEADKHWASSLINRMSQDVRIGIVTSKIIDPRGKHFDSVGDYYTVWGLAFPEGRDEIDKGQYEAAREVFSASGGASMYRRQLFEDIGLFDEDFFAYYEDVDISFRAQLRSWQVWYEPKAIVHHDTGATSRKIKGFTTYMTTKNLPWLMWKNVPTKMLFKIVPRFSLAYFSFIVAALQRRQALFALKGLVVSMIFMPKKLAERLRIQSRRSVSTRDISNKIVYDLPPNADRLRRLRKLMRLSY